MATIGLDKLFYSKITEGENGDETYEVHKDEGRRCGPWRTILA